MPATVDLSTTLAGIPLESCLYNASGPRSGTAAALRKVCDSASCAVLTKSATVKKQSGNPQPRTWHSPDGTASLNSEGLPNNGINYYLAESTYQETMVRDGEAAASSSSKKPYIVSLSGKTLADNIEMLQRIAVAAIPIASVELNLACPNVIGKPIVGYDFDQMREILRTIQKQVTNKHPNFPPLGIKLPPYLDGNHFFQAAEILNEFKSLVRYVVAINTLGNATAVDPYVNQPILSANSGFAGLSGPIVKYTALANVRMLRTHLDASIDVVGVGGIRSGRDVYELLLAGAVACQTATTHWKEGPESFERILGELRDIMVSRGHVSVKQDVCGRLLDWSKAGAAESRKMKKERGGSSGGNESASKLKFFMLLSSILSLVVVVLLGDKFEVLGSKQVVLPPPKGVGADAPSSVQLPVPEEPFPSNLGDDLEDRDVASEEESSEAVEDEIREEL